MNTKVFIYMFFLAVFATGCISEFKANLPATELQILVVDGTVMEDTTVTFHLSKSFSMDSPNVPPEIFDIDAKLTIIGSNGYESAPAIYQGKGAYSIVVGKLDDNVEYGIKIEYAGDTYQSALSKPITTPDIDSISWIQPEKAGKVSFRVSTHDDAGIANCFLWNCTENWEITAYYNVTLFFNPVNNTFYNVFPAPYYYCWRSSRNDKYLIGSTESLSENRIVNKQLYDSDPGDGTGRFTVLYCITVNQQAISKAAFEYYQNKIVVNDQMGGLFTPQPSELTGNITCITNPSKKAMGFVEPVKNIVQKRLFVYPYQISRPAHYNGCDAITTDSLMNLLINNNLSPTYLDAYQVLLFRPVDADPMTGEAADWAPVTCTECTAAGGTKNKPDFWPNNDQ